MTSNETRPERDRRGIALILASALAVYFAGWIVVVVVFGPERENPAEEAKNEKEPASSTPEKTTENRPIDADREEVLQKPEFFGEAAPYKYAGSDAGPRSGLPAPPPGETPAGVELVGDARYANCWEPDGIERQGKECDRILLVEKRFEERLYAVERCRQKAGAGKSRGDLEIGIEVDFETMKTSFWSGPGSSATGAKETTRCMNEEISGLPLDGVRHGFSRYWLFISVRFSQAAPQAEEAAVRPEPDEKEDLENLIANGKTTNVIKDRVRVRKSPVDGEILGMIGSGSRVTLIERKEEWCRVVTERGNVGWMVCWGLDGLDQSEK